MTTDKTIKEIKALTENLDADDPFIKELKKDERKGVIQLLEQIDRKRLNIEKEKSNFEKLRVYEKAVWQQGFTSIAGIDEVGRGPLAGPVVAAAVVLPKNFYLGGLDDSKKLSESKREEYYETIVQGAEGIGVGLIEAEEIDRINIYEATKKAMYEAITNLDNKLDYILIDAMKLQTPYPSQSIIKGDSKSISIAAASIVAKVTRDRLMKEYAVKYPGYGFERNAGYGTKDHLMGLEQLGITSIHRKTFAPVKERIQKQ